MVSTEFCTFWYMKIELSNVIIELYIKVPFSVMKVYGFFIIKVIMKKLTLIHATV